MNAKFAATMQASQSMGETMPAATNEAIQKEEEPVVEAEPEVVEAVEEVQMAAPEVEE